MIVILNVDYRAIKNSTPPVKDSGSLFFEKSDPEMCGGSLFFEKSGPEMFGGS